MSTEAVTRKLAAILSADAVGYSRLMAQDEAATLKTLNAHRGLMGGLIHQHGGRVVDAVGDNLLAEFPSVVDAVACAVAIQDALMKHNADLSDDCQMPFRIGIHLGDVMVEGDQVYGDGVNIAARLEPLADAGGICVSATVHEQIRDKLSHRYEDLGEQSLKNIAHPVRVYRVRPTEGEKADAAAKLTVPGFAGRPAIAVLAFDNLSGDPEQEYFADGIAEDLITRLSAFRLFPVIARNSSFTYKGKSVDVKQVSRELGVRYVVEGSVRKAGTRVRVSAQLIDATTGHHVWAERYDRELGDIFALQDEITETVVGSLEPTLEKAERQRALGKTPQNLDAWDCVQQGLGLLYQFTKDELAKAQSLFRRATELAPYFSPAFSALARSHYYELLYNCSESPARSREECLRAAEKAVALDEDDAIAHVILGYSCVFNGQYDRSITEHQRAIELNPSFAFGYVGLANSFSWSGRPDDAIGLVEKAIRLSPHDPLMSVFLFTLAAAHFVAGRYEEVVSPAKRSLQLNSAFSFAHDLLVASYGHLGRTEEAREALGQRRRVVISDSSAEELFLPPAFVEILLEGWRKAGLERG